MRPTAMTALSAPTALSVPSAASPSLGTLEFEENCWPRSRAHRALRFPGSPEIGQRADHIHGPEPSSGSATRGQVRGPTQHLGAEAGSDRSVVLLRQESPDDAAEHVATSASGEPGVAGGFKFEPRMPEGYKRPTGPVGGGG